MFKPTNIVEKVFLILLAASIVLNLTFFKGNSVNHNKVMYSLLLALFAYIVLKLLLTFKKKRYFIPILLLNVLGFVYSCIQIFKPQDRNSFSGLGQVLSVTLALLPILFVDFILAALNSNHDKS